MQNEKIKQKILVPVTLVLAVLLAGAIFGFHSYQKNELNGDVHEIINSIDQMFQDSLDSDAELMHGLIGFLKEDKRLQNAWLEKDRDELMLLTEPILKDLHSKHRVSHFYFHDTDRVCFLRVHNPPRFGDYIDRFTMAEAAKEAKAVHGIELGPFGTFTLRVVHPWMINGNLAGYIELGEEIEHITPRLSKATDVELVFLIDKKNLDRSKWEKGLRMMGRTGNWDQFPGIVCIDKTMDISSTELHKYTNPSHQEHSGIMFDVESDSRQYRSGFAPLIDTGGRHLGDIIVMKDITAKLTAVKKLTLLIILVSLLIGGFLFVSFYKYFGNIESNLLKSRNDLQAEINERKRVEEKLHTEQEFIQTVLNTIDDGIVACDADGMLTLFNRATEEFHGLPQKQIPSNEWAQYYDLYLADGQTPMKTEDIPLLRALSGKVLRNAEMAIVPKKGKKRFLLASGQQLWDKSGEKIGAVVSMHDITERKLAKEEQISLSTAIEQADETIVITDKDANIQYVNPAFEHITGYTFEEVIGQDINILRSDKHNESFYKEIWDAISQGQVWKGHFINKKKDGSLYDVTATISPIKSAQGDITGFVNIGRDVTEELKMDERLKQSQKMESIGTLAGGIAHDFNNILGIIKGYTELSLDETAEGTPTHNKMQEVIIAAKRAEDLVQQILAFSRQTPQEKKPVKVLPIVKETIKFLRASLPATIGIHQDFHVENDIIMADPTQIHQVLMNLCTNAGHVMKERGGELKISVAETNHDFEKNLQPDFSPGQQIKITVSDTGHGIDKETIEKIFDPYFTTKEMGQGTGLGLSVVHGIVNEYGGVITVNSEVGKGTTFNVYFPLAKQAVDVLRSTEIVPIIGGNERVLLLCTALHYVE